MKKIYILITAFTLITYSSMLNSKTIKVMTINLANNNTMTKSIYKLFNKEKPDIVALQEAVYAKGRVKSKWLKVPKGGSHVVEQIAKKFKYQFSFGYSPNQTPNQYIYWGPAVLSKFKISASQRIPIGNRRVLIKTKYKINGKYITFYATHLPPYWYSGYGTSIKSVKWGIKWGMQVRAKMIKKIIRNIGKRPKRSILAGDFNSLSLLKETDPIKEIMRDLFQIKGKGHGSTYPASFPLTRVDYIFGSKDIKVKKCYVSHYYKDLDHRAVITIVDIK